ncbi:MAG: LolA family protein [Flavobacteriaceae bacterium]
MRVNTKILLFWFIGTFASTVQGQNDTQAKNLLDEVRDQYESYKSLDLAFIYILSNRKEGIDQRAEGTLMAAGDRYQLNIMGVRQIFDGTMLYTIIDENEEVMIQEGADEEGTVSPKQLFDFYSTGYRFQWDILQNVSGKKIRYVKLIPTDPNSQTKYLLAGIDIYKKQLYRLIEVGVNGTETTITISKFAVNKDLPPDAFVFDEQAYSDYYIDRY